MKFKTEPFPHQQDIFDKFKDSKIFALNADMGVGKTKCLIDICSYKFLEGKLDKVLIIAPNGVHAQWINEQYPTHCSVHYNSHIYTSKKTLTYIRQQDSFFWDCRKEKGLKVLAMNVEAFARPKGIDLASEFLDTQDKGCAILIDEATIIKTPDIKTTRNIKKLRDKYPFAFRNTMTGTPAAKSPVDLWSMYDFLKKKYMGMAYITFKLTHTVTFNKKIRRNGRLYNIQDPIKEDLYNNVKSAIEAEKKRAGKLDFYFVEDVRRKYGLSENNFYIIANSKKYSKFKNLDILFDKIKHDTYMIKKADCLKLPPKIYEVKRFPLNPEQKNLIKMLQTYAIAHYRGKELTVEVKALLGLRVLQICGGFFAHHTDIEGEFDTTPIKGKNHKLEYLKHDIKEAGSQQCIIWAVYTAEINLIYNTLRKDHSIGRLDGQVKGQQRIDCIEGFKSGKIQHIVAHPRVAGYGYNFQNASIQYWYSRNYRTENRIQAEDRNYRIGTVKSPIYKDLLCDIPIETNVYKQLKDEQALNELFISHSIKDIFKLK